MFSWFISLFLMFGNHGKPVGTPRLDWMIQEVDTCHQPSICEDQTGCGRGPSAHRLSAQDTLHQASMARRPSLRCRSMTAQLPS